MFIAQGQRPQPLYPRNESVRTCVFFCVRLDIGFGEPQDPHGPSWVNSELRVEAEGRKAGPVFWCYTVFGLHINEGEPLRTKSHACCRRTLTDVRG